MATQLPVPLATEAPSTFHLSTPPQATFSALPLSGFESTPSFELSSTPTTRVQPNAPSRQKHAFQLELSNNEEPQAVTTPMSGGRAIAVSCRLPYTVTKVWHTADTFTWHIEEEPFDLISTALKHFAASAQKVGSFHIGWLDTFVAPCDRPELTSIMIQRHRAVPLFLEKDEVEGFYHGFCKGVLWPLLHYSLRTKNFVNKFKFFGMYEKVNAKFADAVLKVYRRGDVVWVHDYHLLLVPKHVRAILPGCTIGFFMHSPFPTGELFRQLPVRKDLLEGMLAADVIGFNTYAHCNHHRAACEALLSTDTQGRGLLTNDGRFVRTHISPAGLNFAEIKKLVARKGFHAHVRQKLTESGLKGLKIVVGRSRKLDDSQGTLLRLHAFEKFLSNNAEWRGKVVLLEVIDQCAKSADTELQALVQETVGNINGKYGELGKPAPVHLVQPRDSAVFSMQESCELYMMAHVLMVTPLRDGLSLASHEAVACQGDHVTTEGEVWRGNKAPLILSEFAGASTALGGSIIVNPHDVHDVAIKIKTALETDESQRAQQHSHNLEYVSRNTAAFWADSCLQEITATGHARPTGYSAALQSGDVVGEEILPQYNAAAKRLLVLDWDGSVVPLIVNQEAVLPDNVADILDRLTQDPRNEVYVMTGRQRSCMQRLFGDRDNLGLICEHGAFVRPCGQKEWVELTGQQIWLSTIGDLLNDYTERTPGSYTEMKERSITWHWRNTDHDFASWTEKDLLVQLHQQMQSLPFTCFTGRKCVEVLPRGVSKVVSLQWLMENRLKDVDFVLSFGDDRCDEELFEFIQAHRGNGTPLGTSPPLGISPTMSGEIDKIPIGGLASSADVKPPALLENTYQAKGGATRRARSTDKKSPASLTSSQIGAFSADVKRWTVKVGPVSSKTFASASVESHKDAIDILATFAMSESCRMGIAVSPHEVRSPGSEQQGGLGALQRRLSTQSNTECSSPIPTSGSSGTWTERSALPRIMT